MRKLTNNEINLTSGAGDPLADPNSDIIRQIMSGAMWGAAFGIRGGPAGMAIGAGLGVIPVVVQGAASQMPVNVPIPNLPLGPTWNGSRG